ncbi:MAG: hypothetical protein J7549_18490 [Variovorax sp.]|nr:hypothetical protein [Variovorax sp.]
MAANIQKGTKEAIAYRYGSPSTASVSAQVPAATTTPFPASSTYGSAVTWQVGGPYIADYGDYSSNQGQYAFVPDDAGKYVGIGTIEWLAQRNNTFSYAPQNSWTLPDPNVRMATVGTTEYYGAGVPAAMGRCYGTTCAQAVIAFGNGTLGVWGSNTTPTRITAKLDAGKVPTAVTVTNGGEFALITVWDTTDPNTPKGQVAVVALAGSKYHMDWAADYPGLHNEGTYSFMKVLGYVDLPADMTAPTDISAATGVMYESYHRLYPPTGGGSCSSNFVTQNSMPLNVEANRQTFMAGGCNYGSYAHGGVAVVTSKSEGKAAFINLKPLFDYYESMYFTSASNFAQTSNLGQAASQWPYPFSAVQSQMPTVIKTVDLGKRPTAVKVPLWTTQRALIATEDGTLQFYGLANYLTNAAGATPADIALKGSMAIGKNPTALAYSKHDPAGGDPTIDSLIVVSRGESKIQWVNFSADRNSGTIRRTLQDSRLKDPVWAEDNDSHGTDSYVLTVADYAGRQVANYRYGPVVFWSNPNGACAPPSGCGMSGQFEFGGSYSVPGGVYQVTGANVP